MRGLYVLPRADADVDEAAEYYAERGSLEVALRFLSAVQAAYHFICENPEAPPRGQYRSVALQGIRWWRVPGFERHLVFYRLTGDCVQIVRVLHGARDIETVFEADG